METTKEASCSLLDLNSVITSGTPGANMEEASGLKNQLSSGMERSQGESYVRKVIDAMTATLPHFSFSDQLIGFWGSSFPSQSTMFGSTSVFATSCSFSLDDDPRLPASRSISFSSSELASVAFSAWPFEEGFASAAEKAAIC